MTNTARHDDTCDQTTLGWTALQVEQQQGPQFMVSVSELRRAREVYRDAGLLPKCECAERRIKRLTREINTARKSGDERYEELLAERRELAQVVGS